MLPDFSWEVIDNSHGSEHLPICISYASDMLPTAHPPKSNFKTGDWATFQGVASRPAAQSS
ncbi:hypothetical protein E2C01_010035 [Portunus trituberculatus]|uniref:Uncharacterized protein n=1 Tax=Portunus trituberculatus TaxID=210409 RepID=A0A5B7D7K7_PORTR|nr:hypothetical protein [Portunus trituberculatus]